MPRRFYLRSAPRKAVSAAPKKPSYPFWYVPLFAAVGVVIAVAVFWIIPGADQAANRTPAKSTVVATTNVSRDTTLIAPVTRQAVTETAADVKPVTPTVSLNGIRVQVLNGCGVKGLARRLSPALRGLGLDVRETKNAARDDFEYTAIIDRTGKLNEARALADSLGIAAEQVTSETAPNLSDIDLTLVVGLDYRTLNLNYQRTNRE